MRQLILTLPEPISLNVLIRMSYHLRNQRREMLKKAIAKQMTAQFGENWNFPPMKYVRVDAIVTLSSLRDDFELPACLKIEMDAAQEVEVIASDGPSNLARGLIVQRRGTPRGVRVRFTELAEPPTQPEIDF